MWRQHPSKASLATVVTPVSSTTGVEIKPVHSEKAKAPTLITELGMKRSPVRPVHWKKAYAPIEVREVGSDNCPGALKL
jgi:hypothetical protein